MVLPRRKIDDLEFDGFLEAVIKKIPEHSNQWTDYNVTDPGITILELLSWLASSQLFHMDQITDNHRTAFLKLLGCNPVPPRPSSYIGFLDNEPDDRYIPANRRWDDLTKAGNFYLETNGAQYISLVSVEEITRSYLGKKDEKVILPEDEAMGGPLFSDDPDPGDTVTFTLISDGNLNHRVRLYFDLCDMPNVKLREDTELYPSRYFIWEYFALIDAKKEWNQFPVDKIDDGTYCLSRSGILEFNAPDDLYISGSESRFKIRGRSKKPGEETACFEKTPSLRALKANPILLYDKVTLAMDSESIPVNNPEFKAEIPTPAFQGITGIIVQHKDANKDYWVDISENKYSLNPGTALPRIDVIAPGAGEVRALFALSLPAGLKFEDTDDSELLQKGHLTFSSTGLPGFTIELPAPAMPGITIQVYDPSDGWVDWDETDDIRAAGKNDRRFSVSPDRKTVLFGDGDSGMVPPRNLSSSPNIRIINYCITLGDKRDIDGLILFEEGNDGETINEARWRAIEELTSPPAAVTLDDYRDFAYRTPGVNIARAISVVRPVESADTVFSVQNRCREPISDNIGVTNLDCTGKTLNLPKDPGISKKTGDVNKNEERPYRVVVLIIPETAKRPARPTDGTLRTVCKYLDRFRLVTTRLDVQPPVYIPIYINATVAVSSGYNRRDVAAAAGERLLQFFDPLRGGDEGTGWPLGRFIYCYEIAAVLENEPGIARVLEVSIRSPEQKTSDKTSGEITMEWNCLPYLSGDQVYINIFAGDETCY